MEDAAKIAISSKIQEKGPYPIEGSTGCEDGQKCAKDTLLATGDLILLGIADVEDLFAVIELTLGVRAPFSVWEGHCQ